MRTKIVSVAAVVAVAVAGTALDLAVAQRPESSWATASAWIANPRAADAAWTSFVRPDGYAFHAVDAGQVDPTINQWLGVNNDGIIVGYFGSRAHRHPNRGYTVQRDGSVFQDDNLPDSVQTQLVGLDKRGTTVGFMSSMDNAEYSAGWYSVKGRFKTAYGEIASDVDGADAAIHTSLEYLP